MSIGETLEGHALRSSGFHIFFGVSTPTVEVVCTQTLTKKDVEQFSKAVKQRYFYQVSSKPLLLIANTIANKTVANTVPDVL